MKKILLVGDSISLYYSPYLTTYLDGKAEIHSKEGKREAFKDLDKPTGGNGGDSLRVLNYLKERFEAGNMEYDLFAFNCGLHDIKRLNDGDNQISKEDYRKNLLEIIGMMKKSGIKTVFISTTHVEDERHNSREQIDFTRYNRDVEAYNAIAFEVMAENDIPVIELGAFTKKLFGEIFIDHVHFSEEVRKIQAGYLMGKLESYI